MKALWASIASASLRDRPALENPAPAHRRRALRFGPRDRRLHWRRTAAPSKGGLHENQLAYPDRSICGGWAVREDPSPPLTLRGLSRVRRSVAGLGASGGAACGGNAAALRRDCQCVGSGIFDGVAAPAGPVGGMSLAQQLPQGCQILAAGEGFPSCVGLLIRKIFPLDEFIQG